MSTEKIQLVVSARDETKGVLGGLSKRIKGLGPDLKAGIGMGLGLGFTNMIAGAATAVGDFISGSITAASDLNETIGKTEVIFGDSADEIIAWGDTMATSFGIAKTDALDAASTFAGLFQTVGVAADIAKDKSTELVERGADIAAFFNTDVADAIQSLRSGLSGESEPMRKFNVFLSEAAVNAKLLAMGEKKLGGAWSENQKIAGRYAIILEQTAVAAGNFGDTSEGLAGQQKILNAELEDAQAEIGQRLLPMVLGLTQGFRDLIPAVSDAFDILDELDDLGGDWQDFLDNLPSLNIDIGLEPDPTAPTKAIETFTREMVTEVKDKMEPALAQAVDFAFAHGVIDEMQEAFAEAKEIAKNSARAIGNDLAGALKGTKDVIKDAMDTVMWAIKHPMALTRQIANIEGALTTLEYKRGLASNTEGVNVVIDQQMQILRDQWTNLTGRAYGQGVAAVDAYERGLRTFNPPNFSVFGRRPGGNREPGENFGGGGRASGGPVSAGGTYLVGERGPELLHMGGNGSITPNSALGGSAPIIVNIDGHELFRIVDERMGKRLAMTSGNAYTRS